MKISSRHLASLAKQAGLDSGFDLVGVASARNPGADLEYFPQWIEQGYAGEMKYLEARDQRGELRRASLEAVAPWARSVIVCAMNYNSAQPYSTERACDPCRGWIARYAFSREDYHDVILRKLRGVEGNIRSACAGEQNASQSAEIIFRSYVDTGPLIERVFARQAGIGWTGKNTCIINQQLGSWLFLGVILTSLEMQPDIPPPDRCGGCTRCIDACPTQAIRQPYQLDATRCISYLTIEKRGAIAEELRAGMGNHLFGCDICQDVCPWNGGVTESRKPPATAIAGLEPRPELVNPALEWIAEMSREEFQRTFRDSPVKRVKHSGLLRNAAIAMGNSGDPKFLPILEKLSRDAEGVVAEHARWGIERLRHACESDPQNPFSASEAALK